MKGEGMDELQGIGRSGLAMAGLLALGLLAATLAWPVPMMLWDHLDLVSIYEAWERDGLAASGIGDVHHGSHMHLAAYLLLLGTTWLSDGQTWLDCLVSWALLGLYAALLLRATPRALPAVRPWWLLPALVGFVLYPGHLVNLQWGWQVAVFACLAGVAVVLVTLARPAPGWPENLVALAAAAVAVMSFTTGLAIVPVAMALVVLQAKGGVIRRLALLAPWLLLVLAGVLVGSSAEAGVLRVQPGDAALYMLNYLGGGVARFATDIAPWLAFMALASAVAGGWVVRRDPRARLWGGAGVLRPRCRLPDGDGACGGLRARACAGVALRELFERVLARLAGPGRARPAAPVAAGASLPGDPGGLRADVCGGECGAHGQEGPRSGQACG